MTLFKYATLCALFAGSQANIQVNIDSDKIQRFGQDYIQWISGEAQDPKSQQLMKDLNNATNKGQVRIDLNQKKLFSPIVKNLHTYLKFVNQTNPECDEDGFVNCAVHNYTGGNILDEAFKNKCNTKFQCNLALNQMSQEQINKGFQKIGQNNAEFNTQFDKVYWKIVKDYKQAAVKNAEHVMKVAKDVQQKQNHMLKAWGCDAACVDVCTSSPQNFKAKKGCSTCDCPAPFQIRMVSGVQNQFDSPTYDLSILGDDVTSLAAEEKITTKFSQEEIQSFKENNTFYKAIGVTEKNNGINYQAPYFSFAPVEKSSWITPTAVLCSIGLVGAGYVAVTSQKQEQRDGSAFNVELS